jgi:hypothetical protein
MGCSILLVHVGAAGGAATTTGDADEVGTGGTRFNVTAFKDTVSATSNVIRAPLISIPDARMEADPRSAHKRWKRGATLTYVPVVPRDKLRALAMEDA